MSFDEKSGTVPAKTEWGQWSQTIEDVTIEIDVPAGIKSKEIKCDINIDNIIVIVHNSTILQGKLYGIIVKDYSLWTLEDNKLLHIVLQKCERNASNCWKSLLANNEYPVDPLTFQEMEKKLTLERFQNENPGMDFSKAEMTGNYHGGGPKY